MIIIWDENNNQNFQTAVLVLEGVLACCDHILLMNVEITLYVKSKIFFMSNPRSGKFRTLDEDDDNDGQFWSSG